MSTGRTKLMQDLMMVAAGHPVEDVIGAMCDALASAIAFASDERPAADTFVDSLPADLKKIIAENWDYVVSVKVASAAQAGAA